MNQMFNLVNKILDSVSGAVLYGFGKVFMIFVLAKRISFILLFSPISAKMTFSRNLSYNTLLP